MRQFKQLLISTAVILPAVLCGSKILDDWTIAFKLSD